jgi:hypothetical protein
MGTRAALSLGFACLLVGSTLGAESSGASTTAAHSTKAKGHVTISTAQSELTAIRQVRWTSNVAVTLSNGSWTFRSDGVPSPRFTASHYAVPTNPLDVSSVGASVITTSQVLRDQNYSFTLPTTPKYSSTTTTNLGAIGVLLDGAVLYNPYEANKETVATEDNFSATSNGATASFLDSCDGHPGPGGQYHYHGLPDCLVQYATTGASTQTMSVTSFSGSTTAPAPDTNGEARKPVLLGFAFDGYGIYDNVAMNGKAVGVSSLDSCNGIFSPVPGYPHGAYHYVLENVKSDRSSLGCYHGVVSTAYIQALKDSINGLAGNGPAGSGPAGNGPPSGPPPAQGLSNREGPAAIAAETAERLAANKSRVIILIDELDALGHGDLC